MGTERFRGALLSALVIASLITPLLLLSPSPVHAALTPHDPIYIGGNDNFTPANGVTSGSGTENDPYIIENWDISAENANGIEIRNTTAYFVIRNCYVHDGKLSGTPGIYFDNVTNGKIDNNLTENLAHSILLVNSDNNLISKNLVKNNGGAGIYLINSDNNLVSNNTCENNKYYGIYLYHSDNNLIYHNNFVHNENQAYDDSSNTWDNGYPWGGNYWSDYAGADNWRGDRGTLMPGSDGIGDTHYYIPGDNNRDRYPLISPFPPWTGWAVFGVLYQPPPGPIAIICGLETLYAVRLEKNLVLYQGSKLVMKFYTYEGAYENESVIENFTPPWYVKENEVVSHPGNIGVKKARLDLTYDNTENVISTLASWTTGRGDLIRRISQIKLEWSFASPAEKGVLIQEISSIKGLWPWAPT